MSDCYFSIEEIGRIIKLYTESQKLLALQIDQINESIFREKDKIFLYCDKVQKFLHQIQNLIVLDDEKLKKKSIKLKWIKLYFSKSKIQCWIHEDYYTYLICQKKTLKNIQFDKENQQQYNKLVGEFENRAIDYILSVNEQFVKKMFENNQDIQQQIQMDINQYGIYQIINILNDQDNVLTQQEMQQIKEQFKIIAQGFIEQQYQNVLTQIQIYKNYLQNQQIELSDYPQNKCNYDNYADGLKTLKQIEEQIIITEINENQLNNLKKGLYYIKLKKKKMMILLQITKNNKQNAYIINQFQHYQVESLIIEKLKSNLFSCYYLKTITLKNIKEAYLICKYLKKKKKFQEQQMQQTIEIYQKEIFQQIDQEIQNKIENFKSIQNRKKDLIQKITQNQQQINDICLQSFVQILKQTRTFEFNLIEKIQFNQNIKSIQYSTYNLGAVLEDNNNCTQGIVLFIEKKTILVYINNSQGNYQEELDEKSNFKMKIINTQVKDIHSEVSQFYISLLLNQQNNNVSRQIKDFLELKHHVWTNIMNFLD